MTAADRLGRALRRLAANSAISSVRSSEEERVQRHGATSAELNERFLAHVEAVEAKIVQP